MLRAGVLPVMLRWQRFFTVEMIAVYGHHLGPGSGRSEAALLRGRFAREAAATESRKVHLENAQVRISRLSLARANPSRVAERLEHPSLFVDTTSGAVHWPVADEGTTWRDMSFPGADILQFEFKTAPQK